MTTLYAVIPCHYNVEFGITDRGKPYGVFSTKELAEDYKKSIYEFTYKSEVYPEIVPIELDVSNSDIDFLRIVWKD